MTVKKWGREKIIENGLMLSKWESCIRNSWNRWTDMSKKMMIGRYFAIAEAESVLRMWNIKLLKTKNQEIEETTRQRFWEEEEIGETISEIDDDMILWYMMMIFGYWKSFHPLTDFHFLLSVSIAVCCLSLFGLSMSSLNRCYINMVISWASLWQGCLRRSTVRSNRSTQQLCLLFEEGRTEQRVNSIYYYLCYYIATKMKQR